jgi:hypothetical protein
MFYSILRKKRYSLYESDDEKWRPTYLQKYDMYYSNFLQENAIDSFYGKVKEYTNTLINAALSDSADSCTHVVLDQILPPTSIASYSAYFNKVFSFIIDRDPRDLYVIDKAEWGINLFPTESVNDFIEWYRLTRLFRTKDSEQINLCCLLPFESLVYDYDNSLEKIYNFTGLRKEDHLDKLLHFNPEVSIVNTQIFKKHQKYFSDIKKIEKELGAYCYDFPNSKISEVSPNYIYLDDIYKKINHVQQHSFFSINIISRFRLIFYSTIAGKNYYRMLERTGIRKTKSLLKVLASSILVPFEMIFYLILSFFY